MEDKVKLLQQTSFQVVTLYELDGRYDYFYGHMTKRTSDIKAFDLIYYENGFILRRPNDYKNFTLTVLSAVYAHISFLNVKGFS